MINCIVHLAVIRWTTKHPKIPMERQLRSDPTGTRTKKCRKSNRTKQSPRRVDPVISSTNTGIITSTSIKKDAGHRVPCQHWQHWKTETSSRKRKNKNRPNLTLITSGWMPTAAGASYSSGWCSSSSSSTHHRLETKIVQGILLRENMTRFFFSCKYNFTFS